MTYDINDLLYKLCTSPGYEGYWGDDLKIEFFRIMGYSCYDIKYDDKKIFDVTVGDNETSLGWEDGAIANHYSIVMNDISLDENVQFQISYPYVKEYKDFVLYDTNNDCFEVEYSTEEYVFQQSLLHNFNSTGMFKLLKFKNKIDIHIPGQNINLDIRPQNLKIIYKLFGIT